MTHEDDKNKVFLQAERRLGSCFVTVSAGGAAVILAEREKSLLKRR